jgi:hypothetical protein
MEAAMNHPDIDPSLLPGEPLNDSLDDGFSARVDEREAQFSHEPAPTANAQPQLSPKSPF